MMRLKITYILLAVLMLSFAGCDKLIFDQYDPSEERSQGDHKVYLSVNIRSAQATTGLRSINHDALYEDRVHDLAMVIFKSGTAPTGGEVVGVYTTGSLGSSDIATRAFTAEIKPDKYDFYFVANMGLTVEWIKTNITDRTSMDTYLADVARSMNLTPALYEGATSGLAFPMARVYMNQDITSGGTIYQPKPFKPIQYPSEENKVKVNESAAGGEIKDYVELIRVVAKLEVIFSGTSGLTVDKVYFRNANQHFRLIEFESAPTAFFNDNTPAKTKELKQLAGTDTYIYYMPEAIIPSASWTEGTLNQPINYFTVLTKDGDSYDVPIISNETTITADYLSKAKGTHTGYTPAYTIQRNRIYRYTVQISEKIEISYQGDNWNKVTRSTYLGYGYNVHIDENGNVSINNTVDACPPHEIELKIIHTGLTFNGGGTTKTFGTNTGEDAPGAVANFGAMTGFDAVPAGTAYMEVWFNGLKVKTFTK